MTARKFCLELLRLAHDNPDWPGGWVPSPDLTGTTNPATGRADKGGLRPQARIDELIADGWDIERSVVEIGRQTFASYRLRSLKRGEARPERVTLRLTHDQMRALYAGTVPDDVRDWIAEKLDICANQRSLFGDAA